jgi:hypothetical protein
MNVLMFTVFAMAGYVSHNVKIGGRYFYADLMNHQNFLFAYNGTHLDIYDVSNVDNIKLTRTVNITKMHTVIEDDKVFIPIHMEFKLKNGLLFVASEYIDFLKLYIYDITDATRWILKSTYRIDNVTDLLVHGLNVSDNYVYLVTMQRSVDFTNSIYKLQILDISSVEEPWLISSEILKNGRFFSSVSTTPDGVAISYENGLPGIELYSVSDEGNVTFTLESDTINKVSKFISTSDFVGYIITHNDYYTEHNLSTVTFSEEDINVSENSIDLNVESVFLHKSEALDDKLYISKVNTLDIYDISSPLMPRLFGVIQRNVPYGMFGTFVTNNNNIFISDGRLGGFWHYEWNDEGNITLKSYTDNKIHVSNKISISAQTLLSISSYKAQVLSLNEPDEPVVHTNILANETGLWQDGAIDDNTIYLISEKGFHIFDKNGTQKGTYIFGDNEFFNRVKVFGSKAILWLHTNWLRTSYPIMVLDISDKHTPYKLATKDFSFSVVDVCQVDENRVAVAFETLIDDNNETVAALFDISTSGSPTTLGVLKSDIRISDISIYQNKLVILYQDHSSYTHGKSKIAFVDTSKIVGETSMSLAEGVEVDDVYEWIRIINDKLYLQGSDISLYKVLQNEKLEKIGVYDLNKKHPLELSENGFFYIPLDEGGIEKVVPFNYLDKTLTSFIHANETSQYILYLPERQQALLTLDVLNGKANLYVHDMQVLFDENNMTENLTDFLCIANRDDNESKTCLIEASDKARQLYVYVVAQEDTNFTLSSVLKQDNDMDGLVDALDNDDDNDGIADTYEAMAGTDPLDASSKPSDIDRDGIPDNFDEDKDGDGIDNQTELLHGLDPTNTFDATADDDNDGFSNAIEIKIGTDLHNEEDKPVWTPVITDNILTFMPSKRY